MSRGGENRARWIASFPRVSGDEPGDGYQVEHAG